MAGVVKVEKIFTSADLVRRMRRARGVGRKTESESGNSR